MSGVTNIHPQVVLESLLAKGGRSSRRSNLKRMYEICRKQHEAGSKEFSRSNIGRIAEAEGIIKARALYNAQSADYCELIVAWGAYAGPQTPKPPKMLASHEYLLRIEDPAIRSIMQSIIVERDKLKAQLNTIKANTQVTVDRRPIGTDVTATQNQQVMAVFDIATQLTPSEREALQKSVSADYLESRGLKEGTHGEIINDRGRLILEVGFARAIRKLLGT